MWAKSRLYIRDEVPAIMWGLKRWSASLKRWNDPLTVGAKWLFWNFVAMLGLWGTGLLVFFFFENPVWLELIDRGQLFLYSAGFLGQAMFILIKDLKITTFPLRGTLMALTLGCFFLCILFFCGYVFADFSSGPDINPRTNELRFIGLGFLLVSMVIGLVVIIAAEYQTDMDYSKLGQAGIDRLGRRVAEELED